MEFTPEQLSAVIEELEHRSKRIREFSASADTLKEEWLFIGQAEGYKQLVEELRKKGGLSEWD